MSAEMDKDLSFHTESDRGARCALIAFPNEVYVTTKAKSMLNG